MAAQLTTTSGILTPLAVLIDGAGHQFLSRARFPADEHGGVGRGHPPDRLVELLHGRAAPHDGVGRRHGRLGIQGEAAFHQPGRFQRLGDGLEHFRRFEGLQLVIEGPALRGLDGRVGRALAGHDDHGQRRAESA